VSEDVLMSATKDELVLAMLAVLGGERTGVNERDLFLACWHAFPNVMRWVDTALPNPDTFTASLRRLDQRRQILRLGKQQRQTKGRRTSRRSTIDAGRSGVVKARVAEGGLQKAGITEELLAEVRRLRPDPEATRPFQAPLLIAFCVALRDDEGRPPDEGALVELAFHKFPDRFAYAARPEFPDVERVRSAAKAATGAGLIDEGFRLTTKGTAEVAAVRERLDVRLDASEAYKAGDLKFADRIERSPAYSAYAAHGTLVRTKADELFRALRVPPTTSPEPVATALAARVRTLRRIDKTQVANYLLELARKHNPDVIALLEEDPHDTRKGREPEAAARS